SDSTYVGARLIRIAFASMWRNWLPLRPTSFKPREAQQWDRCCKRPGQYLSYLRSSPIQSAPVLLTIWHGRAAMPPAFDVRIRHERKISGTAQADGTQRYPSRSSSGPWNNCWDRSVRLRADRRAGFGDADHPRQYARG